MSAYYTRCVYRYPSKLADDEDFRTDAAAREFDRDFALGRLVQMCAAPLAVALRERDEKLVKSLRFLADEIEAAPREMQAAETP